jgi:hypothetical protein
MNQVLSTDKMLEQRALYLQYTLSFLIGVVQESIPNKFQSAGLLLAAAGINIPNRSIIPGLQCNFPNSQCFPWTSSPTLHHSSGLSPVSFPPSLSQPHTLK